MKEPDDYWAVIEVLDCLPTLVTSYRKEKRLSLRAAAEQIGVSGMTISRVEAGHLGDVRVVRRLVTWLASASEEA